eukprot:c26254_g2_i6 orf=3-302(-)
MRNVARLCRSNEDEGMRSSSWVSREHAGRDTHEANLRRGAGGECGGIWIIIAFSSKRCFRAASLSKRSSAVSLFILLTLQNAKQACVRGVAAYTQGKPKP